MVQAQPAGAQRVSGEGSVAASSLTRWGGPAAVLGGPLVMVGSFFTEYHWMYAAGFAFLVVAITGTYLYLRRSGSPGRSGTVGFYMCVFAFVVITISSLGVLLNIWGARWSDTLSAVNLLVILGVVMFGAAILRNRRLPRGEELGCS